MYRQHQDDTSSAEHFHLPSSSAGSPFAQSQFVSPVYGVDPALHGTPQHLRPAAMPRPGNRQSPRMRQSSVEARDAIALRRTGHLAVSSTPEPGAGLNFRPQDRSPPSRDVTAGSMTDAFVSFILYCNPNFPLDVDTSTLRTTFESPPKSDSKDFETFRLFELIKKFDAKEIKTWGQLALDLGVEAPDTSKGQSVQKVQQYTVRLKRWMRAMHIDAFFEYLLGKQHIYFNEIPHPSDPYPAGGRDGVLTEEDLAVRALDPSFRPKRGRRRNSEAEQEETTEAELKQSLSVERATPYSLAPMSAIPLSAHPDSFNDPWAVASAATPHTFAPWSARSALASSAVSSAPHLRWQMGQSGSPSTPHPMSAIPTSMSAHIDAAFDGEPRSAVTPSRKRRRHGPAVSSAWPSSNPPGAKPRGRPPANRNVTDGPYSTFPVDPGHETPRTLNTLPTPLTAEERPSIERASPESQPSTFMPEGRPGRLSLQVPQHTGNPVRLATPPTLLVNGETKESESRSDSDDAARHMIPLAAANENAMPQTHAVQSSAPQFTFEALKRVVASDLLRADIVGRRQRLTGDEAKRLADAVLDRLAVPRFETSNSQHYLSRLTAALWLGVGDHVSVPLGPSAAHGKRIKVTRFCTDAEGYEEILFDEREMDNVREIFDIYWHVSQGGCMGSFEMKDLSLAGPQAAADPAESSHDMVLRKTFEAVYNLEKAGWLQYSMMDVPQSHSRASREGDDGIDWKARYMAMEFAAKVAKGEVERQKQRMLDKIMDAVL